jgi:two-component system cell cycle sensor histidine kinase/response regulator CckA
MRDEKRAGGYLIRKLEKMNRRLVELENTKAELQQVRELLQKERRTFFPILHKAPYGIALIDKEGKFIYINPAFTNMTGYALKDISAGRDWFHKASPFPAYRNQIIESWRRDIIQKDIERIFSVVCKEGEIKEIEFKPSLMDDGTIVVILSDITERKRAEEALCRSEEQYRLITENTTDLVCTLDLQGNFSYVSPSFKEVLGYTPEELTGFNAFSLIHPDDRETVVKIYQQPLINRQGRRAEFRCRNKNGHWRIFESAGNWIIGGNGNPQKGVIVSRDITERKQGEEALRDSEEKFRDLVENINDVIYTVSKDGIISYISPIVEQVLGYKPAEVIGQPFTRFIHEEDLSKIKEPFPELIEGKHKPGDYRMVGKNGEVRWICTSSRPFYKGSNVVGIRGSLSDITERKQAEEKMAALQEQLRQSQKLEAIGRLAGGIAHDFNNILAVIQGYSELCLFKIAREDPMREDIETIKNAAKRAANLISQLLAFSRRQTMEMKVIDLNPFLQNIEKMLHRVIGEDVEIVMVLADDLGRVKVDPGQIEQIILNLAVNARDAMPSGGKLIIETANVTLAETYRQNSIELKPGHYVMTSMTDTGLGMAQKVKEQIFEPFFTTKEIGKGTGLGLSVVYGIVKQSGGHIGVDSQPGKGTTFRIYFPRMDGPAQEVEDKEVTGLPGGNETILLVEDDEGVRKLTTRVLRKQGYKVLEASQGKEAFSLCVEQKVPIHLMVTDMVMPEITGVALARRLIQFYPEMKVLYMSGYTSDWLALGDGNLGKGIEFIRKPFTLDKLARKIREVLDRQSITT